MNADELRELAELKEREWKNIQEKRIEALEAALKEKNSELDEQKKKFQELKEDFRYNLKLLEERDKELEKFEENFTACRKQISDKNSEISELKIKLDEFKKTIDKEGSNLEDTKKYYIQRLNQKHQEIEQYKIAKDIEINKERADIEKYKRSLQMQLQDLQFDLEKQRNELKTEFDEVMRKREHEWRLLDDQLNTQIIAKDLQLKLLTSENDKLKETNEELKKSKEDCESCKRTAERLLKEKEWELKDVITIKDAKINDLEQKILKNNEDFKDNHGEYLKKLEDLGKSLTDKEIQIQKLKTLQIEFETEKKQHELVINDLKQKTKQKINNLNETIRQKEDAISQLNEELARFKSNLSKEMEINAKQIVNNDVTYNELKITVKKLTCELEARLKDMQKLKQSLQDSIEREDKIERGKQQLELDWQKKYEKLEKCKINESDEFLQKLNESREQALAQIKHLEEKLKYKDNLINAMKSANPTLEFVNVETSEFKLKQENEYLKEVIKQMRDEMEQIADNIPIKQEKTETIDFRPLVVSSTVNQDFTNDLQNEVLKLKEKNRQLQTQIDEYISKQKLPDKITDNVILNNHVKSLNETISSLRKEKVELMSFSKKQQTRLIHIEKQSNENSEQLRLKQTQIETLQYELNSQSRRFTSEISALKQKAADLELELNESRREADEYHKMAIEKNSEISSLELKISELKFKLSQSGNQINFGAQELFIQQLQDEITRLNKKLLTNAGQSSLTTIDGPTVNEINFLKDNQSLKEKLKNAAKHISQLISEKKQLIEMSNQLRGELNRYKQRNDELLVKRLQFEAPQQESKLQQLENMQYELTKKQLALAQHNAVPKKAPLEIDYDTNYTSSQSTDLTPNSISTVKSENIRELWKILDTNDMNESIENRNDLEIKGNKTKLVRPATTAGITTLKKVNDKSNYIPNKQKIRNYNRKD